MEKPYTIIDRVESKGLLLAQFFGTLSFESVQPLVDDLQRFEKQYPKGFNRYTDLSAIKGITITTKDLHRIAERRRSEYAGPQVRSAIFTEDQLTFGMCRIYSAIVYPSPISVSVFYRREECAAFLGVQEPDLSL